MHGRWLVDTPGNRLKIADIENPGILVTVPAHDIAGMEVIEVAGDAIANFQAHLELAALGMRLQFFGTTNVAFAVGRMLQHLPVLIEIAARRLDGAVCLDGQETVLRAIAGEAESIGGAARDDDVVALVIGQQAEVGFDDAMPIVDKVHLVTFAVAIKVVHRLSWAHDANGHVMVKHQDLTAQHGIAAGREWIGLEMYMALLT